MTISRPTIAGRSTPTITDNLNDLFHLGITDAFCGFKAHRVSRDATVEAGLSPATRSRCSFGRRSWPAGLRLRKFRFA